MADTFDVNLFAEFSTSKKETDYTGILVVIIIVVVCGSIGALFFLPIPK